MNLKDFSKSYFTKTDPPHHRVTDGKTSNFPLLSGIEFLLNFLRFLKKSGNLCLIICVEFVKSKFSPPAAGGEMYWNYYYSDNSQNPPYSPFAKGGNCYPPLWKRGARGDFLIKPLNISVLHRAINVICRSSIIYPVRNNAPPSPLRARLRPGRAHAPEGCSSGPEASRGEGEGGGDKAIF